ncbi:MFS transporter [Thermosipho atlanticus]|uniref:Predicted arabinose efflux permease, MFS family n=1 Tax=Thermosipho atlanticus DSM 15807 TaxID=1123380 RepID=A0A1M5T8C0_9BACT|nr:MFS transporter [Thermosipho atlanticus]SHH46956.1 Predicted arabinose efflux permease, MFS family [Thermosipho atlanticus DSM 15807]
MKRKSPKNSLFARNFVLYILGRLVSLIGSGIQMVAIPLYILDLTGSGTAMGIFTLLGMLPRLLAAPFAGVIGDRWNRKNIMVWTDFLRGILILILAFLAYKGAMGIIILFIVQAIVSVLDGFFGSATVAMLPDIVENEHLRKANSVLGSVNSFSMVIGPALGGIIYGISGIAIVFLLNGISFVVSAISEMFITYEMRFKSDQKLNFKLFIVEFKEGLLFIFRKRELKYLVSFALLINFLLYPLYEVVEPYVLRQVVKFDAQQYGFIQAIFTVGLLVGNVILASFLSKARSKVLMISGIFSQTAMLIVFSIFIFPNILSLYAIWEFFIITGVIYFVIGFFNTFVNVPVSTNLQLMTPTNIRSRVFASLEVLIQLMIPLGAVLYGFLLDHVPAHLIFLVISLSVLAVSLIFVFISPEEMFEPKIEEA